MHQHHDERTNGTSTRGDSDSLNPNLKPADENRQTKSGTPGGLCRFSGVMMTPERFSSALTLDAWIGTTRKNTAFWQGVARTARLPDDLAAEAARLTSPVQLLALSEDWCGDAVNTLPMVDRLAAALPQGELRIVGRDANPDLMDAHRTREGRAIPVVIAYDADFQEVGWWGPRPTVLQALYWSELHLLPKDERNLRIRSWYARDRGRSTAREVLDLVHRVAGGRHSPAATPAG